MLLPASWARLRAWAGRWVRVRLSHAQQHEAEVGHLCQHALQLRLVDDVAHEDRLAVAGVQGHAVEGTAEAVAQLTLDDDGVDGHDVRVRHRRRRSVTPRPFHPGVNMDP